MNDNAPIEGKVYAATVGTGAGAILSTLILWILGVTVWGVPITAEQAGNAVAAVPTPIAAAVALVITVGGAFVGGYMAKHTPRINDAELAGYVSREVVAAYQTPSGHIVSGPAWQGDDELPMPEGTPVEINPGSSLGEPYYGPDSVDSIEDPAELDRDQGVELPAAPNDPDGRKLS